MSDDSWKERAEFYGADPDLPPPRMADATNLPIEIASTVFEVVKLLENQPAIAQVRGSMVIWVDDIPVAIIAAAPEYEGEP